MVVVVVVRGGGGGCIKIMFKQPEIILSETNKESCPFIVNIAIDYSLV